MNRKRLALAGRIRAELVEMERAIQRAPKAWLRAAESGDDLYLDSVALNLHSVYTGAERIFELIAQEIDQYRPEGANWHRDLLRQMAVEIRKVRPPVISTETRDMLDAFRGFRHIVRNVYALSLDAPRMERLVSCLPDLFMNLKRELEAFAEVLESDPDPDTTRAT